MFSKNRHPDYRKPLDPADQKVLGQGAVSAVRRFLAYRQDDRPTPLVSLPALASRLGVGTLTIKDESTRLGLGSFKALGGAFAVLNLVLDAARDQLQVPLDFADLDKPQVRSAADKMTFGCATDGNHGRSVAAGAEMVGARAAIFVHEGVSEQRVAAIARFGAQIIRVRGTYDDAVAEAARICAANGWIVVSDTSWPGYERIPGLVMRGYTVMVDEALRSSEAPPTHAFIQAGVGGLAAAVAGHLTARLGKERPKFIVVEPSRAACVLSSAKVNHPIKIAHGEPTVMAMLECYEPSLVAWRVLSRCADVFMTVEEQDAIEAMRTLANPQKGDQPIVAGESGGAGLAGLLCACRDDHMREMLELNQSSRVLLINTEGATDPDRYRQLIGTNPAEVLRAAVI
ncbi:MAG TPA: diaminopropionate ammonia-lyase [Pseudolabrys sp.]|nr:diaminopropionate ammonia-lyase [Pseudolabrys sp.]